jgi:hypothetical protein
MQRSIVKLSSSCQEIQTILETPFFIAGTEKRIALRCPKNVHANVTAYLKNDANLLSKKMSNNITDLHVISPFYSYNITPARAEVNGSNVREMLRDETFHRKQKH